MKETGMLHQATTMSLVILLTLFIGEVQAQKLKVRMAERYAQELDLPKAAEVYEDLALSSKADDDVFRKLAETYLRMGDYQKAETAYGRLVGKGTARPQDLLTYADILRANGKYSEAIVWYESYNDLKPGDVRAKTYVERPDLFEKLRSDSASTIRKLPINSENADLGVTIMEKLVIFSSARGEGVGGKKPYVWDEQPYLNLYTALLQGRNAVDPVVMRKDINSRFHDGTVSFDSIAQRLYFTRNNYHYGVLSLAENGELKLGIFFSDIQEGEYGQMEWAPLVPFDHNDPQYNFGHPCISPDGKTLYYVSDRPGGQGGTDIYKSDNLGNSWGVPQNLGPKINTPGNEMYPYFSKDSVLYFASDGHPGLGELDLFIAPSSSQGFGNVFNLGYPVNTRFNDHGIVMLDDSLGFLVSDRKGGMGSDDIYGLTLAPPIIFLAGTVIDKLTRLPIDNALVTIKDGSGNDMPDAEITVGAEGKFQASARFRNKYQIRGTRKGYFPEEVEVLTATDPLDSIVIELNKYDYGAEGIVMHAETELPMDGVAVRLYDENDVLIDELVTGADGKYTFALEPESNYRIRVERDGFFKQSTRISTKGKPSSIIWTDFKMFELEVDKVVRLENIYYDYNKWNIRPDAAVELNKLVQTLWDNPTVKIELSSHTDCRGSDSYNMSLSEKRAKSAVDHIISQGVPKEQITSKGYGESKPSEACECTKCTEDEHQRNRRTEFKVLDM